MNLMNVLFQQMATEYLRETAVCGPHLSLSPFDYLPHVEHSGEVNPSPAAAPLPRWVSGVAAAP